MTNKGIFDNLFPLDRQEGGNHNKKLKLNPIHLQGPMT